MERAAAFLRELETARVKGVVIRAFEFNYALDAYRGGTVPPKLELGALSTARIEVSPRRAPVGARSHGQRRFIEAMRKSDMVFCIGPAGTGKTFLATAMAVAALREGRWRRARHLDFYPVTSRKNCSLICGPSTMRLVR